MTRRDACCVYHFSGLYRDTPPITSMKYTFFLLALSSLSLSAAPITLFNGKDLSGWKGEG